MAYSDAELLVMSNNLYTGIVAQSQLPFLANTRWQGEAQGAKQVTILSVGDVSFGTYTRGTPLVPQTPDSDNAILAMDQMKGFAVSSYDTQRLVPGYVQAVTAKATKKASLLVDAYVLSLATKTNFPTNFYAGASDAVIEVNGANILDVLDDLGENLDDQNVPMDGRFFCAPPSIVNKIRIGMRKSGLSVGSVENQLLVRPASFQCGGFTILMSNQYVPVGGTGTDFNCFYGHIDAIASAYNPMNIESQRMVLEPGDNLFGVLEYGAKVIDEKVGGVAYLQAKAEA